VDANSSTGKKNSRPAAVAPVVFLLEFGCVGEGAAGAECLAVMFDGIVGESRQDLRFPCRPAEAQEMAGRNQRKCCDDSGADQDRIVQIAHVGLAMWPEVKW
jgi:hypothetical protein